MDLHRGSHVRMGWGDGGMGGMLPWRYHPPAVVLSICFLYDGHDHGSSCDPQETPGDYTC